MRTIKTALAVILLLASSLFILQKADATSDQARIHLINLGEDSLPLDVYILNLPEVGSYGASNHSKVVEGVLEATKVKSFGVFLDNVVNLNVSISAHVISDWEAYRMLIKWGNNAIVINTHDQYLPVPTSYSKEEWVDKIADFMLNRWGTWTHLGGYPFYRVWYQNGTEDDWGEQGFKTLMSHIGSGNATCNLPPNMTPDTHWSTTFAQFYMIDWFLYDYYISNFAEANVGYPINIENFKDVHISTIYSAGYPYETAGILRFTQNQSAFNFGIYVHMTASTFFSMGGQEFTELNDVIRGFIGTAAAIWADIGYSTQQVYGTSAFTPRDAIEIAKFQGRTVGLDRSEELLQKAIDAYNAHEYKLAVAYARQAKTAAENATQPNLLPPIIVGMAVTFTTIGVGAYYKSHNKKRKNEAQNAQTQS